MKKIFLAMMICLMFAGAGYCAPNHHGGHQKQEVKVRPQKHNIVAVRRHKHHIPIYPYEYYPAPCGTQVIINTGGFSVGYSTGYTGSYVTYGGGFSL